MNLAKLRSGSLSPRKKHDPRLSPEKDQFDELSPELVPIVTLMSSQAHRRYHEGIFMLYYDLNGDGKPADREWKEVYGILTGNQLAYWDAAHLAEYRSNPEALLETSAKPNYINFTDSVYNAMKTLPAAKQNLDNVIIVSTTLKNRYIIQLKSYNELVNWYLALRLASYEYQSLQEAYTAALLSARGSRLLDIRTVLAEKRFDHEDWVSIRYGSGMAWKRCYAVVQPSTSKKKSFTPGRILFFENEQKKKKQLMAVVSNASSVTAVFPQSHMLIDHSTMLKLEGFINFKSPSLSTKTSKRSVDDFKNTSIFLMPEQHSSVPGFDTLIRFLMPLLDSFGLYGRPKRLKADRIDPESLLFGLPTLPRVHYLELSDLDKFAQTDSMFSWDVKQWNSNLKAIMKAKLDRGYEGCGSDRGVAGAVSSLSSPRMTSTSSGSTGTRSASSSVSRPVPPPKQSYDRSTSRSGSSDRLAGGFSSDLLPQTSSINKNYNNLKIQTPVTTAGSNNGMGLGIAGASAGTALAASSLNAPASNNHHKSVELADIYQKYLTLKTPSDQFRTDRNELLDKSPERFEESDLPVAFQSMHLGDKFVGSYPKEDIAFSDDDDDEGSALEVPTYGQRDSSYSSVQSPTTQYNEFNRQYASAVDHKKGPLHNVHYGLDDSLESSPPPPPAHTTSIAQSKLSLNLALSISNVPQGTPETAKGDHLSIHSQSAASGHSSPYSEEGDKNQDVHNPPYQSTSMGKVPKLPPVGKPKYITSPNMSQNLPSFQVDEERPYPAQELHVQRSRPQQQSQQPPQLQHQSQKPQPQSQFQPQQQPQSSSRPLRSAAPNPMPSSAPRYARPEAEVVPQAPPQKKEYPQSLQFGYQPQAQPVPKAHGKQVPGYPQNFSQPGGLSQPPVQPNLGQPAYSQPTYGQPVYTQPAYGQPAYTQPAYGQPISPNYPKHQQQPPLGHHGHRKPPANYGIPPSATYQNVPQQRPVQQQGIPPSSSYRQYPQSANPSAMRSYNNPTQQQLQYQFQPQGQPRPHNPGQQPQNPGQHQPQHGRQF